MIVCEHLAQPTAEVDGVRIFCSAGNAESAARPDAEVPGLTIERLGGLGVGQNEVTMNQKQNRTTEARRHGEQQSPNGRLKSICNLQGIGESIRWRGKRLRNPLRSIDQFH